MLYIHYINIYIYIYNIYTIIYIHYIYIHYILFIINIYIYILYTPKHGGTVTLTNIAITGTPGAPKDGSL